MEIEKIVSMLMAPPKPDLEGFKAEVMGSDRLRGLFDLDTRINYWGEAGNIVSAKAHITRKFHPDSYGASRAIYDAYNAYRPTGETPTIRGTREEMHTAVNAAVMKTVKSFFKPEHTAIKRKTSDEALTRGFCINMNLGYTGSPHSCNVLYKDYIYVWNVDKAQRAELERVRDLLPSADDTGNSPEFLADLLKDDEKAQILAKYGFQNVLISEYSKVMLIPIVPVALKLVRNRLRPHSLKGPAVVMKTKKKYFINGVNMSRISTRWRKMDSVYDKFVDTEKGAIRPGMVKEIIQLENTEWRRVLLELTEPEDLLKECDAKLVDGPTEYGNELFRVDIGLGTSWRPGHPWEEKPDERMQRKNLANMLRYKCPSTDRVYVKFVPEEFEKADAAQAWSHHFTLEEYQALSVQS